MTAPTIDAQTRDELDQPPRCECECDRALKSHGPRRCHQSATVYVELHDFARCELPSRRELPNRTASGDIAVLLCDRCLKKAEAGAKMLIRRMPRRAVCPQLPSARGCGRPMATVEDFIPVRRPLNGGAA